MADILKYKGDKLRQHETMENGEIINPYLPSDELAEAVNLAIYLERPLLIRGEPGCGKTKLARAVAYELGLPYENWSVKSTTRAQDGLYTYDAVRRLHDVQLAGKVNDKELDEEISERVRRPEKYITWGPLGKAFLNEERTVLLIDEIDKADIDFPNDLLLELDEQRFIVKELDKEKTADKPAIILGDVKVYPGGEIRANKSPIIFITSNDEKDLPDAFLRRCVFHYIEFPDQKRLIEIMKAHFPDSPEDLIDGVITYFQELREKMKQDRRRKSVSTSELIDWFNVLRKYHADEILEKLSEKLLYPGVLIKNWEDYSRYAGSEKEGRSYDS